MLDAQVYGCSGGSEHGDVGVSPQPTCCYDNRWQLTNIKSGPCSSGASVVGLGYDERGNLANKNGQAYVFDFGNRLREATNQEYYRYDGLGRRALAWHPTQGSIISQYSQSGQLMYQYNERPGAANSSYIYLAGSLVAVREQAGAQVAFKYQHTDALGTPVAETNAAGTVIQRSEYDPFGRLNNRPLTDGPGYTGHVQDAQTGLTYMQQRYYDPQIGRFLSMDPVTADANTGGNFNRYWYANNNPYKFIDPDGRVVAYASPELEDQVKAERAESPLLDKQLSYLESSSKTHLVKTERRIGHQSNVNPDGGGAYQHDSGTPGNGSGSVISIKMSAEKVNIAREEGGRAEAVVVSFGEKLSHEFKHAIDMDMGMLSRLRIINEDRAKDVEDMYRQEQGLEGRRQWVK